MAVSGAGLSASVRFYPGNGAGSFGTFKTYIPGATNYHLSNADFNSDGVPDLLSTASDNTSVMLSASPGTVSISGGSSLCSGSTATLTANGTLNFLWSTGAGTPSITVNPSSNTIYTVTGGSFSGCASSTAAITVSVNPTPTVSVVSTASLLCAGQNASLTASGANTYSWNTSATASLIVVNPSSTTSYTATGTTGGCSQSIVFTQSVSACTGISKSQNTTLCDIYPNPNNGTCTVLLEYSGKATELHIYNVNGQLVSKQMITEANTLLNFGSLPNSVYQVLIFEEGVVKFRQKVVVQ